MHILIVGASRGIGHGLAHAFAHDGHEVVATVRDRQHEAFAGQPRITTLTLDITAPDAGTRFNAIYPPDTFDALVIPAGIFGPRHQNIAQVTRDEIATLFLTNAIAPVGLAQTILPLIRPGGVIAFLSSRTASFSLNDTGDMPLYRASKSALNTLARSFAVSQALPAGRGVLLLHPGWVQTDMGGPDAPVTLADSVAGLRHVISASLDQPDCRFIDYLGHTLPP